MTSNPDESEFEKLLDDSTLGSPAARHIQSLAPGDLFIPRMFSVQDFWWIGLRFAETPGQECLDPRCEHLWGQHLVEPGLDDGEMLGVVKCYFSQCDCLATWTRDQDMITIVRA